MANDTVIDLASPEGIDPLTELLRTGAKKLIAEAVQAELDELMRQFEDERTEDGRRRVVRNGYQPEREILTGVGPVKVKVPKVRSREGEPVSFQSTVVPPYIRKAATLEAAIPWLYLKGIATGQMQSALEALVGPEAKGLSANVVGRLKRQWEAEYKDWCTRDVNDEWVYVWADGIYSGSGRRGPSCAARDYRRQQPGPEALPGDRGRRPGVQAELARGAGVAETARPQGAAEACHW